MQRYIEIHAVKQPLFGADDLEVPALPVLAGALHFLGRMVEAQAYTSGFRDSFLVCAIIFTAAIVPAWIMGMQRAKPG